MKLKQAIATTALAASLGVGMTGVAHAAVPTRKPPSSCVKALDAADQLRDEAATLFSDVADFFSNLQANATTNSDDVIAFVNQLTTDTQTIGQTFTAEKSTVTRLAGQVDTFGGTLPGRAVIAVNSWDFMSDHDRQACEDAGRMAPPDPREMADMARDEAHERGMDAEPWMRVERCPNGCGVTLRAVVAHRSGAYYVDLVCDACGQTVDHDEEGGR